MENNDIFEKLRGLREEAGRLRNLYYDASDKVMAEERRLIDEYALAKRGDCNKPIFLDKQLYKSFHVGCVYVSDRADGKCLFCYLVLPVGCRSSKTMYHDELAEALRKGEEELAKR